MSAHLWKRAPLAVAVAAVALLAGLHLRGSGTESAMADPGLTLGVDAGQDGTSGGGRTMAVGSKGSVDIRVDELGPFVYIAYVVHVRYDDSRLDLTLPHDEYASNIWPDGAGPLDCGDAEPTEDDAGTKDWSGGCTDTSHTGTNYTGVLHTLEFTCENPGVASIEIIRDGGTFLVDRDNNFQYPTAVVNDTITCTTAVGGIAELPALAEGPAEQAGAPSEGSGWSAGGYAALACGLAAAAFAIAVGGWYARRRWLR